MVSVKGKSVNLLRGILAGMAVIRMEEKMTKKAYLMFYNWLNLFYPIKTKLFIIILLWIIEVSFCSLDQYCYFWKIKQLNTD